MRTVSLVGACVTALSFACLSPASAAPVPSASIEGGYNYSTLSGFSGHLNDWNIAGSGSMPLGASAFSVQGDAAYHSFTSSGGSGSLHTTLADINLIWNPAQGRLGLTAGTTEFGGSGSSFHFDNYGGFGVWYPNTQWTLGLKGGTLRSSGSSSNTYWGGEVVGYAKPNLAFNFSADTIQSSGSNLTTYAAGAEWQPWARPLSFGLAYDNFKVGGATINTYEFKLKYYFGGGSTLVEHHRDGPETWGTKQTAVRFLF